MNTQKPAAGSGPYRVSVAISQEVLPVSRQRVREVVSATLEAEQVAAASVNVALVDNPTIHRLNRQFLDHDYATDVLSFLMECKGKSRGSGPRGAGKKLEGEIVVSAEMAVQAAADYNWDPGDELTLYLVHGTLHLCGYDDQTEQEQQVMRTREREILRTWNLTPHYSD